MVEVENNNINYKVYEENGMRKLKTPTGEVYFLVKEEQIQSDIADITKELIGRGKSAIENNQLDLRIWMEQMNNVILIINTYLNDYMKTYNPGEKESIGRFASSLLKFRKKAETSRKEYVESLSSDEFLKFIGGDDLKEMNEEQEKVIILAALEETRTYIRTYDGIIK